MRSKERTLFSSDQESSPGRLLAVLELGEAIVAELGLDSSNDVLGRWMAHHIAELVETAKTAEPADRQTAEERCAALILEVWRHRNCLPEGRRPFERLEPTLDTLAALNPLSPRPFYRREVWDSLDEMDDEAPEAQQWLTLARQCDVAARVILETLLLRAADSATSIEREWVRIAANIDASSVDVEVLSRIIALSDKLKERVPLEEQQTERERPLRRRLDALADFEKVANVIRVDLENRIEAIARNGVSNAG